MKQQWFRGWRGLAAFVIGLTVICAAFVYYLRQPRFTAAQRGYFLARENGCFGCHGPGGRAGVENPGSFKGYIPPWEGPDFGELVANDGELREWIMEGSIERFRSNPLAAYFTGRQVIQMPAYRNILSAAQVDTLITYIHWLNRKDH